MYINCLWVSGQYKGQGYSNLLLSECIKDSEEKGKKGLAIMSSAKKLGFLADPKYLRYKGFQLADEAKPSFQLLYLPFEENAEAPRFRPQVKEPHIDEKGFVLYYTNQCPFPAKYVPVIEEIAAGRGIPFKSIRFEKGEEARNAPAAVTTYCLFYNGEFVTNEILSDKKFEKILTEKGL